MQLVDISSMIPDMEETPPTVFTRVDQSIAALIVGNKHLYDKKTWSLDPNYPGLLEGAKEPSTGKILWDHIESGYLPLPISPWPASEYS
jgi:hypothetical protein